MTIVEVAVVLTAVIYRPTKVHFDTAFWQERAHEARSADGRRLLTELIDCGLMLPVLSCVHCVEIAKKPRELRGSIVGLLEEFVDRRQVLWAPTTHALIRWEWRRRSAGLIGRIPDLDVFSVERIHTIEVAGPVRSSGLAQGQPPFSVMIEGVQRQLVRYMSTSRKLGEALVHAQARRLARHPSRRRYTAAERMARSLTRIPSDAWDRPVDHSASGLDAMPADRIKNAFEEGNDLSDDLVRGGIDLTHAEDLLHLGPAVYADAAFVDAKTRDKLVRGKYCPPHIRRNGQELRFLRELLDKT